MNKFTRSQMGKIMACALSAAMAVTVVPTYMKPITVYADGEMGLGTAQQGTDITDIITISEGDFENAKYVALYSTNSSSAKPAYVLEIEEIKNGDEDPTYSCKIPYTVPTGIYYGNLVENATSEYGEEPGFIIEITSGTAAKGVVLPDDTNIYYRVAEDEVLYSNVEALPITLKGADNATYSNISINATCKAFDETDAEDSDESKESKIVETTVLLNDDENYDNESKTYITEVGAFKIKYDPATNTIAAKVTKLPNTEPEEEKKYKADEVTITVSINVVGRKNPYKDEIVLTAKKDEAAAITEKDLSVKFDNKLVVVGQEVAVTTKNANTTSKEKVYYTLTSEDYEDAECEIAQDGTITLKKDTTVYATYDINAGILIPKKAGKFTVAMFVDSNGNEKYDAKEEGVKEESEDVTDVTATETVEAVKFSMGTNGTIAGVVGDTTVKANVTDGKEEEGVITFVEYTVEDTDIATISGNDVDATVTFRKAGITKVDVVITCKPEDDVVYKFKTSAYIVVAPKDTTDFAITDIDNAELYVNELQNADKLTEELALQVGNAVVENTIDASSLSKDAYAKAEEALYSQLDDYNYYLENESGDVEATGLLFAVYDKEVADAEEPDEPVEIKLVVNGVSPKEYEYVQDDSVCDFTADVTVDGKVAELQQPVWLTVTDDTFKKDGVYTVYDDGEVQFIAKCKVDGELTFQTTSFSVFSIVATPDATPTDKAEGLDKDDNSSTTSDIYDKVNFVAHVQRRIGTDDKADIEQTLSEDGVITIGTHGQSRRIEKITLTGLDAEDVEMTAHVQKRVDHPEDIEDLTQVVNEDGSISIGTEHQSRRIEAFSMKLKGDLAEQYDVYYRVHAQNYGWLGWAKNGETAGTSGHSFRLEGIEIIFVEKGTDFDETQYAKTTEEGDRGYAGQAAYMDRK